MSKRSALFVDDEPNVLDGLRRMLRGLRKDWELLFATSGAEAMDILHQRADAKDQTIAQPVDVVIADMRMPGMDGAQLLAKVQTHYPAVIRLVLSGHSEYRSIMDSIKSTHQFLAKPCSQATLEAALHRAAWLADLNLEPGVRAVITRLESLPSLPDAYVAIEQEMAREEPSLKRIGEIVSLDMGASADILKLVNSSFFGLVTRVTDPAQAVNLLGTDTLRGVILSAHLFQSFAGRTDDAALFAGLWKHANRTAGLAKALAEHEAPGDPYLAGQCFIAGLLHDVGVLAMLASAREQYAPVLERLQRGETIVEAERDALETDHAAIGCYLLGLWGMNEDILAAVAHHHEPGKAQGAPLTLTAVHVANALEQESETRQAELDMDYLAGAGALDKLEAWREVCRARAEEWKDA